MNELTISISELRNHYDEYIRQVKSGNVILITKYGKPVAQLGPPKLIEEKQKILIPNEQKK